VLCQPRGMCLAKTLSIRQEWPPWKAKTFSPAAPLSGHGALTMGYTSSSGSSSAEQGDLWREATGLAREIGEVLTRRNLTLAVAESATGGLICHLITEIPGSSRYFLGGVVAYHNQVKEQLLGVSKDILYSRGAVSQETVAAMAEGVRRLFGAHVGIASSGIAGPTGYPRQAHRSGLCGGL